MYRTGAGDKADASDWHQFLEGPEQKVKRFRKQGAKRMSTSSVSPVWVLLCSFLSLRSYPAYLSAEL